jgi:ammonia channel protein AmtB
VSAVCGACCRSVSSPATTTHSSAARTAGLIYGGGVEQLAVQALMALIILAWVTISTGALFFIIKKTIGLRVSREEEIEGLDVLEHGLQGYASDMAHTS